MKARPRCQAIKVPLRSRNVGRNKARSAHRILWPAINERARVADKTRGCIVRFVPNRALGFGETLLLSDASGTTAYCDVSSDV